jgi:hypothetical protein
MSVSRICALALSTIVLATGLAVGGNAHQDEEWMVGGATGAVAGKASKFVVVSHFEMRGL